MVKKFSRFAFVALTGLFSVAPVLAQNATSEIDPEHSTARLYLASTRNPDRNLNARVARVSGVVKPSSGDPATPDFDFTIDTADMKPSPANRAADGPGEEPDYTVIAFKSRRVVSLAADTYRVSGDLTLTSVQRTVSLDPRGGDSGPSYGPSITLSRTQPASFEFRRATPSAGTANAQWIASGSISTEDFPELLAAVSSAVSSVSRADEQCTPPSETGGEDDSGPASTGQRIKTPAPEDLRRDAPATAGEDFSGEVSTEIAPAVVTPDQGQSLAAKRPDKADSNRILANEVRIELDLFTTGPGSTVSVASGQ